MSYLLWTWDHYSSRSCNLPHKCFSPNFSPGREGLRYPRGSTSQIHIEKCIWAEQGMDYDRHRVAYPDSSSRNDVLFSCGEHAIKRQLIAVSYLKMGLSYRELPRPRSCPLQGSIHLVNEEGGGIKVQSGHLCEKNSHSRAPHHGKGFVGPEMYFNFLYPILPPPLSFTGIVLIFKNIW